jgi:hypothetical protein
MNRVESPSDLGRCQAKVVSVNESGMTADELAQVVRACAWVRMTAGFLPYLRPFLQLRLRNDAGLNRKIVCLSARQIFRLWEIIKEEQLFSSTFPDAANAEEDWNVWQQSQR